MKIVIEFVEPEMQRYPTCGDYVIDKGGNWQIKVSKMSDARSMIAVALHELSEMGHVVTNEIPIEAIDRWDIDYETSRKPGDNSEPGEHPSAPYHQSHAIATVLEILYCESLDLPWKEHSEIVLRSLA